MCTHTWSLIAFLAWRHHWPSSLLPLCFPSPRLHVPPVLTSSRLCWGTKNVQASVLRRNKDREEEGWKRYMKWAWLTGSVKVNRAAAASNSTFLHTGLGSTHLFQRYILFLNPKSYVISLDDILIPVHFALQLSSGVFLLLQGWAGISCISCSVNHKTRCSLASSFSL